MKNTEQTTSFIHLTFKTFRLLSGNQRTNAIKIVGLSFIQASLEVLSVATVIPLFYFLIDSTAAHMDSSFLKTMIGVTSLFSGPTLLAIVVIAFLIKNILGLLFTFHQSQYIKEISVSFSEKLYQRFYQQRWTDYLRDNSAEIVRKIKTTPSDFANYVVQGHLQLITDLCVCLLTLIGMLWFDSRIILIMIALLIPVAGLYYLFRKKILSKINISFRKLTPVGNIVLTQGIDSFAETKIYQKENFFIKRFMDIRRITALHLANLTTVTSFPAKFFEVVAILSFAAIIIYSRFYNLERDHLIIWLGLLSIAMYRIIPPVNRILANVSQIQAYSYSVSELKEGFKLKDEDEENEFIKTGTLPFTNSIQFKNITYQYTKGSKEFQLYNINLTLHKGDFVLLEGPSGSGKTTFIHLLGGLIKEYKGSILIDDEILSNSTCSAWQGKLGFVPQASIVLQDTVLNNIAFGEAESEIDIEAVQHALDMTGLTEFVNQLPLHLQTQVGENGLTLSGGQRQRLVLARALYRSPEILLLDEVTNQLDEDNKLKILNTLKELSCKGKTIVFASHDHTARGFANRILYFDSKIVREIQQNQPFA
jgi:ABC-type bacteriocin/lantibiotic exporter with double-glycine peptidase domain